MLSIILVLFTSLSLPSSHHCLHSHYPLPITVSTLTCIILPRFVLPASLCFPSFTPRPIPLPLPLLPLCICSPLLQFQPHHRPLGCRVCSNRHCLGDCMHLRVLLLLLESLHTHVHTQICTCNSDYQTILGLYIRECTLSHSVCLYCFFILHVELTAVSFILYANVNRSTNHELRPSLQCVPVAYYREHVPIHHHVRYVENIILCRPGNNSILS